MSRIKYTTLVFVLFAILSFYSCSSNHWQAINLENYDLKPYSGRHCPGILGEEELDFSLSDLKYNSDSVMISGIIFDHDTKESWAAEIWIGKFHEDDRALKLAEKRDSIRAYQDGSFAHKFKLQKDDYVFFDEIGYMPSYFKIYQFLLDNNFIIENN